MPRRQATGFTAALEDYLETIYLLTTQERVARVRDISRLRGVKPGSVSPALRRLSELGLVNWEQGSYVVLTEEGERRARKITTRHRILTRFLTDVLTMSRELAEEDACALEHSLSDEAMDSLVRLFEFLSVCPQSRTGFLERFRACPVVHGDADTCEADCANRGAGRRPALQETTLLQLAPGESAKVLRVDASGPERMTLLNLGLIPDTPVRLDRLQPGGNYRRIALGQGTVDLPLEQAGFVIVHLAEID